MRRTVLLLAFAAVASALEDYPDIPDFGTHGNMGTPKPSGFKANSEKTYEDKVSDWKAQNKKADFISKVKKDTKDNALKGKRADRLWVHMMDLFDNRGVRFTDEGITYYLPITHHLTLLPDILCEGIEFVMRFLRFYYYAALHLIHADAIDNHHHAIEWLNKSGWASLITGACLVYLGFSAVSWVIYRFSDGIFPAERAANKETRRLANEYLKSKREN